MGKKKKYNYFFDHANKLYVGPKDPNHPYITRVLQRGLWIFYSQKYRNGVRYSLGEFVYWWVFNPERKKIKPSSHAHVGRINHRKPYSFDNILIQTLVENNRERNLRRGNPGKTHRKVKAIGPRGGVKIFPTEISAATYYGIDRKTIWNRCNYRTTKTHNGPKNKSRDVRFEWM